MSEELKPRSNRPIDCGGIWKKYTKTTNKPYLFIKFTILFTAYAGELVRIFP